MESYVLHIDETLPKPFLGLGGLICAVEELPGVEAHWNMLKTSMGLSPGNELKWALPKDHETRVLIQGTTWKQQSIRAPAMVNTITQLNVSLLCDVLVDCREMSGRSATDFYRHALKWLLANFSRFLGDRGHPPGPHLVIVDDPPVPKKMKNPGLREDSSYAWLTRRERIAFDVYEDAYTYGFPDFPYTRTPLKDLGFYPSLMVAHADVNPFLQIADVVVGATTQCVRENLMNCIVSQPSTSQISTFPPVMPKIVMLEQKGDTCMPTLFKKFRGYETRRVIPLGLGIFPPHAEGVRELIQKMASWYPPLVIGTPDSGSW